MGVCREGDNRDEGWRDTGSRRKKKRGEKSQRGVCVWVQVIWGASKRRMGGDQQDGKGERMGKGFPAR